MWRGGSPRALGAGAAGVGGLAALALLHTRIRPHIWKRSLGLTSDKEQARLRAMQLFPSADPRLKKHHGRAEALLLAHYGWQHQRQVY